MAIYFIQARCPSALIKIGWSRRGIDVRIECIRGMSPVPLRYLGSIEGSRKDEMALHERFREGRHHGEWFLPSDALTTHIQGLIRKSIGEPLEKWKADPITPERKAKVDEVLRALFTARLRQGEVQRAPKA